MKKIEMLYGEIAQCRKYREKSVGRSFEFCLSFVPETAGFFEEIKRFIWESRKTMTHFCNRYEGPVLIDITMWSQCCSNTYFESFLYYLKDNTKTMPCALMSQTACGSSILDAIGSIFDIVPVYLNDSIDRDNTVGRMGFSINEDKEDEHHV